MSTTLGPAAPPAPSRSTAARAAAPLYAAFAVSGVAGLLYELLWARYLALFVGHSAYAQVLVIGVYLGGMAVGSLLVGDLSKRLRRPLLAYALAELALAAFGALFHPLFTGVTGLAYHALFPALPSGVVAAARWAIAIALILPPAVILGTTFPLMAAGAIRILPKGSGHTLSALYAVNTLGGAAGIMIGGFLLAPLLGLPGNLMVAAALNVAAAALAWTVSRSPRSSEPHPERYRHQTPDPRPPTPGPPKLAPMLLGVAFLTAVASFAYEVGWLRLLSLVMGSATHSFEIMLSAFLLGLGIGAWLIRRDADRAPDPVRRLGWIQWAMGIAAVATLPLYAVSFQAMSALVNTLPRTGAGYAAFAAGRYVIALAIMVPSTMLAGMTLPLITNTLLRAGAGEKAIGAVYGWNTLGAVIGVALAGLFGLPLLGLKGLLVAGASLDAGLGIFLLARTSGAVHGPARARARLAGLVAAAAALVIIVSAASIVRLDRSLLTSGVFRYGGLPDPELREVLYYADGRTATVTVHVDSPSELVVLSTNGKPDASLTRRWLSAATDSLPRVPIWAQDEATQMLSGMIALAHAPAAADVAVIGHGSGITAHLLLGSPAIERLVTIEIEPRMIDGSRVYHPANARAFDDPRASFAIDDAKSWFARQRGRFDLIVSEPSNPWVSGTAGLFTVEFYEHVRTWLADDGVFAQWLHLYETNDALVASVVAALHESFDDYRAWLVGPTDMLIVATPAAALPAPAWSVFDHVATDLAHIPRVTAGQLEALWMFDRAAVAPVFDRGDVAANSDYAPVLELGAERSRFFDTTAHGFHGLATDPFRLAAALSDHRIAPMEYAMPISTGIGSLMDATLGGWLRKTIDNRFWLGKVPIEAFRAPTDRYLALRLFLADGRAPFDWSMWTGWVQRIARDVHGGAAGITDSSFYAPLDDYLAAVPPPRAATASLDFLRAAQAWDWPAAADHVQLLAATLERDEPWIDARTLLDAGTVALLRTGRAQDALDLIDRLAPATGRTEADFRVRLLRAWARQ